MTPDQPPLVLASASPRRAALLREARIEHVVFPSPLAEPDNRPDHVSPGAWAEALAYLKARSVADPHPGRWVLGADTIVVCAGRVLGKPRDAADARRMLELQAGRASEVITGVALVRVGAAVDTAVRRKLAHAVTQVWMRDDAGQREAYIAGGEWEGKAGAYGIQDVGDRLVERIGGSFSNVVGLPINLVLRMLAVAVR